MCALVSIMAFGCNSIDAANDKISDCLEDEFGEQDAEDKKSEWELTCDEEEEDCADCIDCVLDVTCSELFEGDCDDTCQ